MIIKGYIFSILYVLLCVALAGLLHDFGMPKKYTRKVVHILVGFEWVILQHCFGASVHFLLVCILFTLLLTLDYRFKILSAMSSDGDNAPGTVYYAIAMTLLSTACFFCEELMMPFGIAVFCTSFGDGLAGVVGQAVKKHNPKIYKSKSLLGTLTNFLVCFFVPLIFSLVYSYPISIWQCIVIAIFAAELELFASRGLDNIILTLLVAALSFSLCYYPETANYILPILVTPLIIAVSYTKRALTLGGIVLAVIMDITVSVSLGNFGFCVLATFFTGSIVVDKIKKRRKNIEQNTDFGIEKRGDCRDSIQVIANGAVAMIAAMIYIFIPDKIFVIMFVAAIAEAFADTVASGIGAFSGKVYDVFRWKKCESGLSGGMSFLGTLSSFLAAGIIAILALCFGALNLSEMLIITFSGFFGNVFDSFLGSLVQLKYKCSVCGKILEKEEHCAISTEHYRGVKFINNDTVNFLGTLFAALLAAVVFFGI